jgi:TolB-like protein/lipoprotein NlpI
MQAPVEEILPAPAYGRLAFLKSWVLALALLGVAAVVFALAWPRLFQKSHRTDSIAVLPLLTQRGGNEDYDIADSMTDSIIDALSLLPQLRVISHASVFQYRSRIADPRQAGRELGVVTVLTGRLVQRGDDLTLHLELSDTSDGRRLWGQQYDGKIGDVIALQQEVAGAVADSLRVGVNPDQRRQMNTPATTNAEAQQLYLKARYHFFKEEPEEVLKARQIFQQAIDKDPNFALAYCGIGDTYMWMAFEGVQPLGEVSQQALQVYLKANQLNGSLAEVHAGLGIVKLNMWDWPTAARELEQALRINPNDFVNHYMYSIYLRTMKKFPEAIRHARTGVELNPLLMSARSHLALTLYYAGQYDAALEEFRKLARDYPQLPSTHAGLYAVFMKKGLQKEAVQEWQKSFELAGEVDSAHELASAKTDWAAARKRVLRRQIEALNQSASQQYVSPVEFAYRYALLGDKDNAFRWLEKAYAEHSPALANLSVDPDYDNLRDDSHFADLLARLHLPQ